MNALSASVPSIDELRSIGLFGGLDDAPLRELMAKLEPRTAEPGEVVFREGDPGRSLYVVLSGELEVTRRCKAGHSVRVALLGPRDWFGEMAVLEIRDRSATVRAVAPSQLLRLSSSDLRGLYRSNLKAYTLLIMNLAREMSRRLRVTDTILANTVGAMVGRHSDPKP